MYKKNLSTCSLYLLLDAKWLRIAGIQYTEYLAFDTQGNLLHRLLRKGGESTYGYRTILRELKELGYIPFIVISDGSTGIASALRYMNISRHQRCHVHLLRDLRVGLRMNRGTRRYTRKWFIYAYAKLLLNARTAQQYDQRLRHVMRCVEILYLPHGEGEYNTLKMFIRTLPLAFTFLEYPDLSIPTNTNQIEGYISQLNARLKTMRGLKSPLNTDNILNAIHYYLRE